MGSRRGLRVPYEAQPTRQGGETLQQTYDTIANKFEKMSKYENALRPDIV
jgi:hypothetical protein